MMLFLLLSLLTVAVLLGLLLPLLWRQSVTPPRRDYDVMVYRDQLAEVERDIDRGLLTGDQGDGARLEIQRRLLTAATLDEPESAVRVSSRRWLLPGALALLLPVLGGAIYIHLGAPQLPDQPFASRQSDPQFRMANMADRLAQDMQKQPTAEGYATLAETLTSLKRFDEAVDAYRHALQLGAVDAEMLASLGEAIVMSNDGMVGPDARKAFQHALMLDAGDPRSRFYLGMAEAQIGQYAPAVAIWRDLEKDSPAGAPWLPMLREHIAGYAKMGGFDAATIPPKGPPPLDAAAMAQAPALPEPTPESMPSGAAAAAVMAQSPEEQAKTIRAMVDGLAARLEQNPNDLAGWQRLARAYQVLGETEKAKAAAAHAAALSR